MFDHLIKGLTRYAWISAPPDSVDLRSASP